MKYNITLNQPLMIKHNLNVTQWCILDIISIAPTWCEPISKDGEIYFWVARQKIAEELKALDLKPDTIYRIMKKLVELGFLEYVKLGKKDLVRLSKKGKDLFSSTMSEMNPNHYVGNESENNSDLNPTYNTTNINNNTSNNKNTKKDLAQEYINENKIEDSRLIEIVKDFISWRITLKKPIKTTGPIKAYLNALKELQQLGHKASDCIQKMKDDEWITIKVDYIHKDVKQNTNSNTSGLQASLDVINEMYGNKETFDCRQDMELIEGEIE